MLLPLFSGHDCPLSLLGLCRHLPLLQVEALPCPPVCPLLCWREGQSRLSAEAEPSFCPAGRFCSLSTHLWVVILVCLLHSGPSAKVAPVALVPMWPGAPSGLGLFPSFTPTTHSHRAPRRAPPWRAPCFHVRLVSFLLQIDLN